jgi:CRISPR-associated protein Csb3
MIIDIIGGLESALTHFALAGLAGILEEAGARHVRLGWTDGDPAGARLSWDGPDTGEAVKAHARRHTGKDSWVQLTLSGGKVPQGVFSPRVKPAEDNDDPTVAIDWWAQLDRMRNSALDGDDLTDLDRLMIAGLGEPGRWIIDKKGELKTDWAASRWEMVSRSRGKTFTWSRLAKLADAISTWEPDKILDGITGRQRHDIATGQNRLTSRTSTGLTTPRPTDAALAWCGLWGISSFTLVPLVGQVNATAGAHPHYAEHPASAVIPVLEHPVSIAFWRAMMASRVVADLASNNRERRQLAADELSARGVIGACTFPIRTVKNSKLSAPERMILDGTFQPLATLFAPV